MDIKIAIDDTRNFDDVVYIARDYEDGINALILVMPDVLYLDHDLGDFHDGREWTGYDIACWLEQNPEYLPDKVICVSSNPIGRKRIDAAIESARRRKNECRAST